MSSGQLLRFGGRSSIVHSRNQLIQQMQNQIGFTSKIKYVARPFRDKMVGRFVNTEYVTGSNETFSTFKLNNIFDNRQFKNRFSGGDQPSVYPVWYVSTIGHNGLPGSAWMEAAFYSDKDKFHETERAVKQKALDVVRAFHDPEKVMANKCLVRYRRSDIWNPKVVDLTDPEILHFFDHELKDIRKRFFDQLVLETETGEHDVIGGFSPEKLHAILSSGEVSAEDMLISSDLYSIPQIIGNAISTSGMVLRYPSARLKTAINQDFVDGSSNCVLPMSSMKQLELMDVHEFDANERRFKKTEAEDIPP